MTISSATQSTSPALAPPVDPVGPLGPGGDPHRLLRSWRPGHSSWFSGPQGALLARGVDRVLPDTDPDAVASRLREVAARGGAPAIAVGALPFDSAPDTATRGHLVVPRSVERAGPLGPVLVDRAVRPSIPGALRPCPDGPGYEAMVVEALTRMAEGDLEKVVLARTLELLADEPVDAAPMLRELARRDPRSYLFGITLPGDPNGPGGTTGPDGTNGPDSDGAGPRTLLGASPELLLSRRDGRIIANPLAGSAARSTDPVEDARRGEELLASAKNRHEHALVVREVVAALAPLCVEIEAPESPSLVATATLWHLSTTIRARVADPSVGSLHVARALHPTPAVCGVPRATAERAIREIEPFDRGFYTGMVGWTDAEGDGEWVIALRCGEVAGRTVRLYAGAGIVSASQPAEELIETAVKLRTLLDVMGLDET